MKPLRTQVGAVIADDGEQQKRRREQSYARRRQQRTASRASADAHQPVHCKDSEDIEDRGVNVIGPGSGNTAESRDECGSVTERRRIDVVETSAAIPERLPAGMRQVVA